MTLPFRSGLLPYSAAERSADRESRRDLIERGLIRKKACPSGQRYDIEATPETRDRALRRIGERDAT